jgi:hypothetical protein
MMEKKVKGGAVRKTHLLVLGLTGICLLSFACIRPAPGPGLIATAGWEKLGQRMVSFAADHDVILAGGQGRFNRLMIVVRDSALEMYDIKVTFGNGQHWSPATRLVFGEDTRSRIIDVPGADRFIRRVDFFYRSLGLASGRATVELWGK